jgi:hypothetical protein
MYALYTRDTKVARLHRLLRFCLGQNLCKDFAVIQVRLTSRTRCRQWCCCLGGTTFPLSASAKSGTMPGFIFFSLQVLSVTTSSPHGYAPLFLVLRLFVLVFELCRSESINLRLGMAGVFFGIQSFGLTKMFDNFKNRGTIGGVILPTRFHNLHQSSFD